VSTPTAAPIEHGPKLVKATPVSLKDAGVTESWLEEQIENEPTMLRLGDVAVIERQRRQEKAGRLDLLLEDDSGRKRYEVELMLGPTDESHLIRTVEYWDIERRKWPGYEHCAVLIAEDVASRFLNVISLLSGTVSFVVIQVNGLKVDGKLILSFVKVLDSRSLRKDETSELSEKVTDRSYWLSRANAAIVELTEKCIEIINQAFSVPRGTTYKRYYIGLSDGIRPESFVRFWPKKTFVWARFNALGSDESWLKPLEDAGLDAEMGNEDLWVKLTPRVFDENKELLTELLQTAVREYENG
jgi:hypothetical protein